MVHAMGNGGQRGSCGARRTGWLRARTAMAASIVKAAGYDESRLKPASIVVGNAKAGEAFFTAKCAACHSATGDLRGIATKIQDERMLQQTWLMPGSGGGRGAAAPVTLEPVTVTV